MNAQTKARAIAALLTSAAEIAADLANDLADSAAILPQPDKIDGMVGAVMHNEDAVSQLAAIFVSIKSLARVAVVS